MIIVGWLLALYFAVGAVVAVGFHFLMEFTVKYYDEDSPTYKAMEAMMQRSGHFLLLLSVVLTWPRDIRGVIIAWKKLVKVMREDK